MLYNKLTKSDKIFNNNKKKQNALDRCPFCLNISKNEFSAKIRIFQFLDDKITQLHEKKSEKTSKKLVRKSSKGYTNKIDFIGTIYKENLTISSFHK